MTVVMFVCLVASDGLVRVQAQVRGDADVTSGAGAEWARTMWDTRVTVPSTSLPPTHTRTH